MSCVDLVEMKLSFLGAFKAVETKKHVCTNKLMKNLSFLDTWRVVESCVDLCRLRVFHIFEYN